MSEMVERVALGICNLLRKDRGVPALSSLDCLGSFAEKYREQARAAIEAMREPTEEMKLSGDDQSDGNGRSTWRVMIDAALR